MLLYPSSSFLVAVATLVSAVHAQTSPTTVGNEGFRVPPLSCFGPTPTLKFDMTASVSDLSGVTYHPVTQTLFTVNNGDRIIYELDETFTLVQSWNVSALTLDLEGITVMPSTTPSEDASIRGHFAITDENPASVILVTLHDDGSYSNDAVIFAGLAEPAASNLGFEGLAYLAGSDSFVIAQEATPAKLWQLSADTDDEGEDDMAANDTAAANDTTTSGSGYSIRDLTGDLIDHPEFQIRSIGGITRGGDSMEEVFVVVKTYTGLGRNNETYYQKGIFRYDLIAGEFTERFGGEVCSMGQPEGLTFWKNGTTIRMLVVGETYEALIYEADESCTDALGSVSFDMATCPKQEVSVAACEKTLDDGGCGWLRCDKDQTFHTKICTDDVPGETDCTEAECFAFCETSAFVEVATSRQANGTEPVQQVCTHWAYDVAEKECTCLFRMSCLDTTNDLLVFLSYHFAFSFSGYIFSGCNNAKWDEDYTLYAMEDPTCEKTFEDFPNGCEQRRCDKDQSTVSTVGTKKFYLI